MTSFLSELSVYVGRAREFDRTDTRVYVAWIGLMMGLCASTGGFLMAGHLKGVRYPGEAWLVPLGALVFSLSIAVDTIGHRTIYKEALKGGEQLVHHITIATGILACVFLCAAYVERSRYWIPAAVMTALSFLYSFIDEAFHWRRYVSARADRVEMWSHVGILVGHGTMMLGWWSWYLQGYSGVAETLPLIWPGR